MPRAGNEFQTIHSEGGLLPADLLRRAVDAKGNLPGAKPEDYGLPQGERINEAITQSWNRMRRHWAEFRAAARNLPENEPGTGLTNDKWSVPLLRELGFGLLPTSIGPAVNGRTYAINRFFGPTAIHLVGCGVNLDRRAAGVRGAAATNPHGLVQEFLNRSPGHLWAIVSNGLRFRVLRDNQALSRQSFLEFDLEAMFAGEVFSDFVLLWLMAHATRFAPQADGRPETCWLEQWTKLADEEGTRALGDLRTGVEKALQILGEAFVSHPKNTALRETLRGQHVSLSDFHGQLLRLVYRLIFLFVAEDRTLDGASLLHPRDDSEDARLARERYAAHYSTARLRDLAGKIKGTRHGDLWQQFNLLVGALSGDERFAAVRENLALPVLGSFLWNPDSTTALNATSMNADSGVELANADFLETLRHLAYTRRGKVLRPVDYKNLGAEELGGVYETLLALTPQISGDGTRFTFAEFAGNERKTSGSYYTPDSLVQCLLDSALDPVVEEALQGKSGADAEQAILNLKVCDPAVGSGHFLVGAAHRLARHLARVRANSQGESEPSPLLYQQALRDVIGRCLYGVDINPMSAELCRVSLWLEALEPGKPLSFLDHHIQVGNSLLGTTPALLAQGIPDDAFKPIEGDVKSRCTELKRENKRERQEYKTGQGYLFDPPHKLGNLAAEFAKIDAAGDDTPDAVQEKERRYAELVKGQAYQFGRLLADTWCAAFVWKKDDSELGKLCPTERYFRKVESHAAASLLPHVRVEVERLRDQYQFFHWHLAFPDVFRLPGTDASPENAHTGWSGGFDVVLGNPPWVRQELLKPIKRLLQMFSSFASTADSSVYFLDLSVQTCRRSGRVAMLTPNKWFRATYAERLRDVLRQNCRVQLLVDFGHSRTLFPDADTFPAAVVLQPVGYAVGSSETTSFVLAHDADREHVALSQLISQNAILVPHGNLRTARWQLEDASASDLLDRLTHSGVHLDSCGSRPIVRGLLSGFNEAFYVDTSCRDAMLATEPTSAPLFKKLLRGRDVKRWTISWADQWHIVIPSSQNRRWPWSGAASELEAEKLFADAHPTIHAHLKRFESSLRARQDKGEYWWELRACDYYDDFESPKILVQCIAYYSQFALDVKGHYVNNKVLVIPTDDFYILAILNSRVIWWIVNRTFQHMKDEGLSVDVQFLRRLPIPDVSDELRSQISGEAERLTTLSESGHSNEHISNHEIRLNEMVYRAFALTDAEREVLEASLPPRDPLDTWTTPQERDASSKAHPAREAARPQPVFIDTAFPSSARERHLCAALLDLVQATPGLPSTAYLDELGLATHTSRCQHLLSGTDRESFTHVTQNALGDLISAPNTSLPWRDLRNTLVGNRSLREDNGVLSPGENLSAVRQAYPAIDPRFLAFVAKAAERLRELQAGAAAADAEETEAVSESRRWRETVSTS